MKLFICLLTLCLFSTNTWARDPISTVSIQFTIERNGKRFQDILVMTQAQYDSLSDAQLESRKEARYSAWLAFVDAESHRPPSTKAQLTTRRNAILAQIAELEAEAEALRTQIRDMP